MRSPIRYPGGKGLYTNKLLPLVPLHTCYGEGFGGGASMLFAKTPAKLEVYNDLNHGLVTLFKVLRDPDKFLQFQLMIELTPYSCEEYYDCRDSWFTECNELELARKFFVSSRQGFSAHQGKDGWSFRKPSKDYKTIITRWLGAIEALPEVHERLRQVQIEHMGFEQFIDRYDSSQTLLYLDPPYYNITGIYRFDFTEQDHERLIELLGSGVKSKVMLSNYRNDLYDILLDFGWRTYEFDTNARTSAATSGNKHASKRTEVVYMNY